MHTCSGSPPMTLLDVPPFSQRARAGGGGGRGVSAKCEVMEFCLKLATSKKGGGLPLLRTTEIFENAPWGVTVDVHKCVFVLFWGMHKEIWGCLASKVTDVCMLTGCCCFTYPVCGGAVA